MKAMHKIRERNEAIKKMQEEESKKLAMAESQEQEVSME